MRGPSVKRLIERLQQDPDPLQRAAAAKELSKFKDRASFTALLAAIDCERDFDVQVAVLAALEGRPDYTVRLKIIEKRLQSKKHLIERLRDHFDPLERAGAAEKLGNFKDDLSYKALVAALADKHLSVLEAAAKALARRRQPRAVKPLVNAFRSGLMQGEMFEARKFAEALGELADPRALAPLIESLAQVEDWIRDDISKALAKFGKIAGPPLIGALNHADHRIRAGAASALTILAPHVVEHLVWTLRNGKLNERLGAATALSGAPGSETVDALVAATLDSAGRVIIAAAGSLGNLRDPRALDALVALLANPRTPIRRAAVAALGKLEDPRAVNPLITTLADSEIRTETEWSLVALGAMAVYPLAQVLGTAQGDVAECAATVLGRIGRAALDPLLENLRGLQWRRRRAAAVGLGCTCKRNDAWHTPLYPTELGDVASALQDALQDESAEVRAVAAESLGVLAGVAHDGVRDGDGWLLMRDLPNQEAEMQLIKEAAQTSIRRLVQVLDDPTFGVRAAAAKALGIIGDATAKEPLLDMVKRPSETARMAAAEALMLVHDQEDVTAIVEILAERDVAVRHAVTMAITRHVTDPEHATGWFYLRKDYVQVYIPSAVSEVLTALARLAQEEGNLQVRLASLQALDTIREAIRQKREQGPLDIQYYLPEGVPRPSSLLHIETEQETVARDAATREARRNEFDRFTDLSIYEGHLFPGDRPNPAFRQPDQVAMRSGHRYTLEVAIRRERSGIAAATPAVRSVLNPRQTTETLRIFVVASVLLGSITIDEPVAAVDWPYNTDSGPAFFRLDVPDKLSEPEEATVEVRLYHQNLDLLDVVTLTFSVMPTEGQADVLPTRIDWPRSWRTEPRLDPDEAIRKLTIRIGPAVEGYKVNFIFLREDRTISFPFERHVTTGDLEALLTKVRDFWTELVITNYESRLSVTLPTWNRYLGRLSELGLEAWELLFGSRTGSQKGASETISDLLVGMNFATATHVQVTYDKRVNDFIFPWSILYPPTSRSAAVDALLFWGARYQVEQVWEGGSQDGLGTEPVGVSIVVDPGFGEVKTEIDMFEGFKAAASGRLDINSPISDRQGLFATLLESPSRHFYYFFCHGYAPGGPAIMRRDTVRLLRETIEALSPSERKPWDNLLALTARMGDEAWMFIGDAQITESELRRVRDFFKQRRPILFLNMCHSAALAPSITRGLLRLFLDRDAAALIGTESPMTSVFAHAFARELLKHLFGGSDLGTALWRARRKFLSDEFRNPLGFAYTLYGRATVKLGVNPLVTAEPT